MTLPASSLGELAAPQSGQKLSPVDTLSIRGLAPRPALGSLATSPRAHPASVLGLRLARQILTPLGVGDGPNRVPLALFRTTPSWQAQAQACR